MQQYLRGDHIYQNKHLEQIIFRSIRAFRVEIFALYFSVLSYLWRYLKHILFTRRVNGDFAIGMFHWVRPTLNMSCQLPHLVRKIVHLWCTIFFHTYEVPCLGILYGLTSRHLDTLQSGLQSSLDMVDQISDTLCELTYHIICTSPC